MNDGVIFMEFDQNNKKYSKDDLNKIISENEDIIKKLNSDLSEKNTIMSRTKSYLFDLEFDLNNAKNKINSLEADLAKNEIEINYKDNKIQDINSQIENNKIEINNLLNQISFLEGEFIQKNNQLSSLEKELDEKNNTLDIQKEAFDFMEKKYVLQSSKLDTKEYCISCYEEKIIDDALEIEYLKNNVLIRKFLNPFTYFYLFFKSKPKEIPINFKLYNALKNSKCFNVGYYLNNNDDLVGSRWCKYLSPELHYVCNGFDEGRKFNKKYYNRDSKKELLDYISKCSRLENDFNK